DISSRGGHHNSFHCFGLLAQGRLLGKHRRRAGFRKSGGIISNFSGAWKFRNAKIKNLKISFLSLDGKSCDCRSERGEENTERRAFFTLPRIQIFLSTQRLTKISPACQRRNRHKRGSLIRVPKTLPAVHRHAQRTA